MIIKLTPEQVLLASEERWKYIAQDKDGDNFIYLDRPEKGYKYWRCVYSGEEQVEVIIDWTAHGEQWTDHIVSREDAERSYKFGELKEAVSKVKIGDVAMPKVEAPPLDCRIGAEVVVEYHDHNKWRGTLVTIIENKHLDMRAIVATPAGVMLNVVMSHVRFTGSK